MQSGYDLNKIIIILVILLSIIFVWLGLTVARSTPSSFDISVSKSLQEEIDEERPLDLSSPVILVSLLGNPVVSPVSVLLVSLLFFYTSNKREAAFVLLVFAADVLNILIKLIVQRPRPSKEIIHVLQKFNDSSFPSGHVEHYVVFLGFILAVIIYRKKFSLPVRILMSILLIGLIITIPISRIYLGAHWVTDVLGGYLMGFIFLFLLLHFYFRRPDFYYLRGNR